MRHNKKKGMKLGTDASHTKAMKRSLVRALLANDRIKTTVQRAKAIRPEVDAVITWAKRGDLASRRHAISKVGDAELVREVFEKAEQGLWADRDGGYTRIMRIGNRKGDNAQMVLIEMVNESVVKKPSNKKAAPKTEAPTKVEEVVEKAEETLEEVTEEVSEATEAVEEAVEEAAEEAAEATEEAAEEATEAVEKAAEEVAEAAEEAVEEATEE